MAIANKLFPLMHDIEKRFGTWHRFIGAPGFPSHFMYNKDSSFGSSEKVLVEYASDGRLSKVTGTNSSQQTASVQFDWNDSTKRSSATLKKGSTTELTIEEWISVGTDTILYIDSKYSSNSAYNVQVRVFRPAGAVNPKFYVEVDINSKTLSGTVDISSEEVPQLLHDMIDELNSVNSKATVAALENNILTAVMIEAWKHGSYGIEAWQHTLDGIGTLLSDTLPTNVIGSCVYYGVSNTLADKSADAS